MSATNEQEILIRCQRQAEHVEERLLAFLLQLDACQSMQIGDAKFIAAQARTLAFDAIQLVREVL